MNSTVIFQKLYTNLSSLSLTLGLSYRKEDFPVFFISLPHLVPVEALAVSFCLFDPSHILPAAIQTPVGKPGYQRHLLTLVDLPS